MALIEAANIVREFTQGELSVRALDGVSFELESGEFAALVGPSGSGKTTLLNIVGALDTPSSGSIRVDGRELGTMKSNELADFRLYKIGFVFQAYNLIPVLTARENVEYVLVMQGVSAAERTERAMRLFEEMEMGDLLNRFPRELSGGQQQRVAVARALISEPKVVLADEPTANLDSRNADMLLDLMAAMCEKKSTAFLFSTHDARVMERAKRLLPMRDGRFETRSAA